jgi:hypothetical protein
MRASGGGVKRSRTSWLGRRVDGPRRAPHADGDIATAHVSSSAASQPFRPLEVLMPARHAARIACATTADRDARRAQRAAAVARVPANAPAGLFAAGRWAGSLSGEPALQPYGGNPRAGGIGSEPRVPLLGQRVEREFAIEVSAWRDSTRLAFVFEPGGMSTNGRSGRMLPRALQVSGDTLHFMLPGVLGHRDVNCRLVLGRARTWDGPCFTQGGDRAAVMTLSIPKPTSATGDR